MDFKKALHAIGKALLYYAVYFGWQLIVVQWASFAASFYVSLTYDYSALLGDAAVESGIGGFQQLPPDVLLEITEQTYELVMKYNILLTLISGILALVTYIIIFRARGKKLTTEIGLTRISPSAAVTAFTLGAALNVFASMLMSIIPFPKAWMDEYAEASTVVFDSNIFGSVLAVVIAMPILEEIVFRGLIHSRLKAGFPMLAAMILSSWGFGMIHGTVVWILYASVLGFILVWAGEKYRSLTVCILMHIGFNLFGELSNLLGEISDPVFWILLISGGLVSAALIFHIQRTSEYKIELVMPQSTDETTPM